MKATDDQLIDSYNRLGNIWKVADEFGMCGQSVWERLNKIGIELNNRPISDTELDRIKEVYNSGIKRGDNKLKLLSEEIGRTIPFISRKAKMMGLTSYNRESTDAFCENIRKNAKKWIKEKGHPKGFAGHHHTEESKKKMAKKSKEFWENMTDEKLLEIKRKTHNTRIMKGIKINNRPSHRTSWKQQWATIGGKKHYFRSQWEVNYAIFLEFLKGNGDIKEWEFEPDTFWFESIQRGVRSYLPDFKVTENNGDIIYHEVKGWMDAASKTKIKRMAKYHPDIKLIIIREKQYKEILKKFSFLYNY